jgi:hypothetical protein
MLRYVKICGKVRHHLKYAGLYDIVVVLVEYTGADGIMREYVIRCRGIPEYAILSHNMPRHARSGENAPQCATLCQNVGEYGQLCRDVAEDVPICDITSEYELL